MSTKVSAAVARPIRGAGQNGIAYGIVSWWAAAHSLTPEQFGLAVLILGAVVTYLHNLAEDRGWIPALLKAEPPADDPVPVVDTTVTDAAAKAVTKAHKKTTAKRKKDTGLTALGAVLIALIVFLAFGLGIGAHPLFFLLLLLIVVVLLV